MRKFTVFTVAAILALATAPSAQQAGAIQAAAALGVANIKTLQFTGLGTIYSVGQNYLPTEPWPPVTLKSYTASINYDTGSMREELLREMGAIMPRGGGAPFFGEQRRIKVVGGNFAWNVRAPANPPAGAPQPAAAPGAQLERMLFLWATPQGFVKAAMANNATTRNVRGNTEVSFLVGGKYRMTGTINPQGLVERVETLIDHPLVGDMPVVTRYTEYIDFGGVMFPARIVQTQDGFLSLDLTVVTVTANPNFDAPVPDSVRNAQPAPVNVASAAVAPGVYHLTGSGHHSLAVEMRDHIVIGDLPTSEARGMAVIAKAKELMPNKPVRFVIMQHHHWDHTSGIRAGIDEGATIVTHQSNQALLERVAKSPHTIVPDRLATSKRPLSIQTVGDKGQLTDGTRTIELHRTASYDHAGDMLLLYLPAEKILAAPDIFNPPAKPGVADIPARAVFAKALYDNIQRLELDVQTIVPYHGNRTIPIAELAQVAGAQPPTTN